MNSRDAAYDEEEQLRRAIEASKEETITEENDGPSRRPKRIRDDDEEFVLPKDCCPPEGNRVTDVQIHRQLEFKRQRTASKSPSPSGDQALMASREDSDDDISLRNGSSKKSSRNAARTHRERTERDERREEQERKRAEAASKRKGRAERRRADGTTATETTIFVKIYEADMDLDVESDPSEEMPLAVRAAANRTTESVQPPDPPTSSQPAPDTPPASQIPLNSHKKKAPTQHKKKGRNQYTKDRDMHDNEESPARSVSRDVPRHADEHGTAHTKAPTHEGGSKQHNKSKGGMSSKITMSDMKRRANNILEFITRTQVELANEPLSEKNSPRQIAAGDGAGGDVPPMQINGGGSNKAVAVHESRPAANGNSKVKDFKELSCVEMMDALTRDLVKWQQEFTA
jgi:hypothetical protein